MIKLTRVQTAQAITGALRGKHRVNKLLDMLGALQANGGSLDSKYWKSKDHWGKAKPQLKQESHEKCAYCEAPTAVVAHGDVEHFRPKSKYWWLAYYVGNYVYACQICNQVYKSDNFPVHGIELSLNPPLPNPFPNPWPDEQRKAVAARLCPDPLHDDEGQPVADFLAEAALEEADLVDPYSEDPADIFKYVVSDNLKQVRMAPQNQNNPRHVRAYDASVEFLGLNREELLRLRYEQYRTLNALRLAFQSGQLPASVQEATREVLKASIEDSAEYSGMSRYFVKKVWNLNLD